MLNVDHQPPSFNPLIEFFVSLEFFFIYAVIKHFIFYCIFDEICKARYVHNNIETITTTLLKKNRENNFIQKLLSKFRHCAHIRLNIRLDTTFDKNCSVQKLGREWEKTAFYLFKWFASNYTFCTTQRWNSEKPMKKRFSFRG